MSLSLSLVAKTMPQGLEDRIAYDPTPFVHDSIDSVVNTMLEAIWRISCSCRPGAPPSSASGGVCLPHSDLHSHAAVGFYLNALTLFGLVLAIGQVVDNVEQNIEVGLSPRQRQLTQRFGVVK